MKKNKYILVIICIFLVVICCGCVTKKNPTTTTGTPTEITQSNVYIRYANVKPTADADILPVGQYGPWMGICGLNLPSAPTDYTKYNWARIQGSDGKDGKDGIGQDGQDGKDGLSAFELFQKNYPESTMTEIEWLASLKGSDGKDGQDGKDGIGQDGKDGKDGRNGQNADIVSVSGNTINCNVITGGDSLYLIRAYCVVPIVAPAVVTVEYTGCSACTSVAPYVPNMLNTRYYIDRGMWTEANSQIIITIPVSPKLKNYYESGDNFAVKINGVNVEFATLEKGSF